MKRTNSESNNITLTEVAAGGIFYIKVFLKFRRKTPVPESLSEI